MNKYSRGKSISVLAGNVVYDVKVSSPDLFPKDNISNFTAVSTIGEVFQISVTSSDGVDHAYFTVAVGNQYKLENVLVSNIKIRSTNANTIHLVTSLESS